MKKLLLLLAMVIGLSATGYAQKGMTQAGVDGSYLYDINFKEGYTGGDIKVMFNTSNHYRIALAYNILGGNNEGQWLAEFDNHVFFGGVRPFRMYFLLGVGYGKMVYKKNLDEYVYDYDYNGDGYLKSYELYEVKKEAMILGRAGFGFDFRITSFLSAQLEITALGGINTGFKDLNLFGGQAKLGVTYNF